MGLIRKSILPLLLIITVAYAGYFFIRTRDVCRDPVKYALGTFDPRFKVSEEDFLFAAEEATHIWENAIGRDLFKYVDTVKNPTRFERYFTRPPIILRLSYDERQQIAEQRKILISEVGETRNEAEEIKVQLEALQMKYETLKSEYLSMLDAYKRRKGNYNALEAKRLEVNNLADQLQNLVKKYNYLVSSVNSRINTINEYAGYEFEEGQYKSDERGEYITIFEFGDRATLVRVLAHEFGHALGLEHTDNEKSIMYYLNTNKNLIPTGEDRDSLKKICRIK